MKLLNALVATGLLNLFSLGLHAAPVPVSTSSEPGNSGAGNSLAPAFSADGRFVVFVSHANNLVTNDDHGLNLDVFVRDTVSSNTVLVSVGTSGVGGANDDAVSPSISSNGQFVAFASRASNLVNNDTNEACDVFVRDTAAKTTRLVSVDVTGTKNALGEPRTAPYPLESSDPIISADGRWVAFQSSASNLVSLPDANRATDVFIRDMESNVTYLVSVNASGNASAADASELCAMTPDGRFVAFSSTAFDVVDGTDWVSEDLYVRDMQSNQTHWVTCNLYQYFSQPFRAFNPVLSPDGRFVAFKAQEIQSNNVCVFRHDIQTGTTLLIATDSNPTTDPSLSVDGRYVAVETFDAICLYDSQKDETRFLTLSTTLPSELWYLGGDFSVFGTASTPVLNADASKMLFLFTLPASGVSILTNYSQLYVQNLADEPAQLVSVRRDGGSAGYGLWNTVPAISPDGGKVAFECADEGLVFDDNNRASDIFLRDLAAETTDLVSVRDTELPALTGTGNSWVDPNSVSADGKTILFTSWDNNLYKLDTNLMQDVWLRNMGSNSVVALSHQLRLTQDTNWSQYGQMGAPFITSDGRYATYAWGGYSGGHVDADIYRQELVGTNFEVVTNITDGSSYGYVTSRDPNMFPSSPMTSDGRFVLFEAVATSNIFVKDMESGAFYAPGAVQPNGFYRGGSTHPKVSSNDRWMLFFSELSWRVHYNYDYSYYNGHLTTNYYYTYEYYTGPITVYAMDLPAYIAAVDGSSNTFVNPREFTRIVKPNNLTSYDRYFVTNAVFSANSRYIAFHGSDRIIYRHDLLAPTNVENVLVCTNCMSPSMSGDGRFVVYEVPRAPLVNDIYVKDLETGEAQLVSANRAGTGANGNSYTAQISFDARYIVFASSASDLVENDTNHSSDIFVRDRVRGVTMLLSANSAGTGSGNSGSANPILAADGRTVVFQSFATDFAPGSYYDARNIFTVRLGGADTDHDGLEDDWELAYFGDLSRDGTGDYDQDGLTDLQEFTTGTDPTNVGSVFRAYTVSASGGPTTVFWSAVPGKIYRVEYKENIDDVNWTELSTATAGGTTGSALDATPNTSHRFYRVVLAK